MEEYREFIVTLRELELEDVYILLHENLTPIFSKYVKLVRDLKFEDGTYDTYYGELKKIVTSYTAFYNDKIDQAIKDADKYMNTSTKEIIVELCNKTIDRYTKKQQNFEFQFLPTRNASEEDAYNRIKNKMSSFIAKLEDLQTQVQKLDKQFKVDAFARKVLPSSITGDYKKFKYTHQFLSRMLAKRVTDIDTSISEVMIKVCHVFKRLQSECEESINTLLYQLYNVNKESIRLHRRHRRCTIDNAEVNKSIALIRQKIDELYPQDAPLRRLQDEVQYWTRKSQEIDYIATALAKLNNEKKELNYRERKFLLADKDLFAPLRYLTIAFLSYCACFSADEETVSLTDEYELFTLAMIQRRKVEVDVKYDEVARCLYTFFSLRGSNIIYYRDSNGQYYVDEYGHKIYSFDYGLELCFLHRDGSLVDVADIEKLYFDEYGRYIYEESVGSTSMSTISTGSSSSQESLFVGSDENVGGVLSTQQSIHSRSKARLDKKKEREINITNKLDKETVTYLWDVFGSILPDALFDVFATQPKNPIHCLAHNLLKYKYAQTKAERKEKKEAAEQYRDQIIKDVYQKTKSEALAWKSKMVKRRKPEESCDIENYLIETLNCAQHDFIIGYNFSNEL